MNELEDAKQKAATTYNAASGYYDHPANTFWDATGEALSSDWDSRPLFKIGTISPIEPIATISRSSRIRHPAIPCPLPLAKAPESC